MIVYRKYKKEADIVKMLGWAMDSCGDAAIVYAPTGAELDLSCFVASIDSVTVCDRCYRACCWNGILMCDDADIAGTVDLPRKVLTKLDLEHSDYWKSDHD